MKKLQFAVMHYLKISFPYFAQSEELESADYKSTGMKLFIVQIIEQQAGMFIGVIGK